MRLLALTLAAIAAINIPDEQIFRDVAGHRWIDRAAQCWQESRFNPRAENPYSHAKGRMQFMPATWKEMQDDGVVPKGTSPFDPYWSVVAGHTYMNRQEAFTRRRSPGTDPWLGGLACYNWGPGNWQKAVNRARSTGATGALAWVKYCPEETRTYIRVIPERADAYRKEYPNG